MAFMERGNFPSIGENGNNTGSGRNCNDWFCYRHYYYSEPVDKVFVAMYMVAAIVFLVILSVMLMFTYKTTIMDPIDGTKKVIIYTYLSLIIGLFVITFIINYFTKGEEKSINGLAIILAISMLFTFAYIGVKVNFDSKYTKAEFEKIYVMQKESNSIASKNIEKVDYVNECLRLSTVFSGKFYGILGIHQLLNILIICQILKKIKTRNKKDKLSKDDLILFDDEQNVKM